MAGRIRIKAKSLWRGKASGPALITRERISFSGGMIDPRRGVFVSPVTELKGASFAGAVLIFTSGKGPTSGASMLDLACRHGNKPAAIVNLEIDPITAAACALQDIPFLQISDPGIFDRVKNGDRITVDADKGEIILG
jgi:predicted aconitase with swiveling domain